MCPLSSAPVRSFTTGWACDLRFGASPSRDIAPSRPSVGLALLQRYSLRSPTHDRPHVSMSEAFLSALASCRIPPNTPCGWRLLMSSMKARVGLLRSQFPLLASLGRCSPPGLSAVQTGQCLWLPAPYPLPFWLQRFSLLRWIYVTMAHYPFACAAHKCLLDGIPGLRLPGSAVYPRFRP